MKIPINFLKKAISHLLKINSNPCLPILEAVKISKDEKVITFEVTNLEEHLSMFYKFPDQNVLFDMQENDKNSEVFLINLKELKNYLKGIKGNKELTLKDTDKYVSADIILDNFLIEHNFKKYPIEDYPEILPVNGEEEENKIPCTTLENIRKAIPSAAGRNDTRVSLQGVLLEPDAVVASNGKELVKLHGVTGIKEPVVIPVTKFIKSAEFAKSEGTITIDDAGPVKQCRISTDSWSYTVKCPIVNYPNYRQVIPNETGNPIILNNNTIEYFKKGIPTLQGDENYNTVHLFADSKMIKILPEDIQSPGLIKMGNFRINKPIKISVNRNLLLRAFDLECNKFYFNDGFGPILGRNEKGIYVFMPLRQNKDK